MNINDYQDFVANTTSRASNNFTDFVDQLTQLDATDINIPLLMTAAIGLAAESGEFAEIVKKTLFQGKPLDDAAVFHMARELGDCLWYIANAARSINMSLTDIVELNIDKLQARYPNGFEVARSENRAAGDI